MTRRFDDSSHRFGPSSGVAVPAALDEGCPPECYRRHAEGHRLEQTRHPNPAIERGRQASHALTRLLAGWAETYPIPDDAFERWFGDGPPGMRFPAEPFVLLEWVVLGYRAHPHAPTEAERRLAKARFRNEALEALTRAAVAAVPALVRVVAVEVGVSLTLQPLYPVGPVVVAHDRGSSCVTHVGDVFATRTLPAEPTTLLRPISPTVGASPT